MEGGASNPRPGPGADLFHRFLAKFLDFLGTAALLQILWPVGAAAGLTYLLIADGFPGGQSLGKRLTGVRVVRRKSGAPCRFQDSILRNADLGVVFLLLLFPLLGWILFFTVGVLAILFECYLVVVEEGGGRVGDILADTQVLDLRSDV